MSNAKTPKTLDVEQQKQLLEALLKTSSPVPTARKGIRNHLMACLMLDAGLRVGEVVSLKLSHIFFNYEPVRTLVLTPSITKNHKERTVPVGTRLRDSLISYRTNFVPPNAIIYDDYCFYTSDSKHCMTTRQVENIITTAALKCWGRRINPHMLRHTYASRMMRVTNMRTVQELLGHNYITSTQIYTHPNEDDKFKAMVDLENREDPTHPDHPLPDE